MNGGRVTMKAVGEAAGVSAMTVSRALKGDPSIPEATALRVREVAAQMGYHSSTLASVVMSHLRRGRGEASATFGFLTGDVEREGWRRRPYYQDFFEGARERAQASGIRMDVVWMAEPGMQSRRIDEIVRARGLSGLIVGPWVAGGRMPELAELKLPMVVFGYSVEHALNRVASDQFRAMERMFGEVRARGHERVGAIITELGDRRRAYGWSGAYYVDSARLGEAARVPLLALRGYSNPAWDDRIAEWLEQCRPDAVAIEGGLARRVQAVVEKKKRKPWLVSLDLHTDPWVGVGIWRDFREMGMATSDLLLSQLMQGEWDRTPSPRTLLLEGHWVEP